MVAEVAEYFQKFDFTVLIYDPRSIGLSDGTPRNEIHPSRNVEDYHDALTFLKGHPLVDPARIAYWGFSYSALSQQGHGSFVISLYFVLGLLECHTLLFHANMTGLLSGVNIFNGIN